MIHLMLSPRKPCRLLLHHFWIQIDVAAALYRVTWSENGVERERDGN